MLDSRIVSTPSGHQIRLITDQSPKIDAERKEMNKVSYANIVDSIMCVMIYTRPDIAQVVSVASRYMANPGKPHWQGLKWILRYLKGTPDYGIMYKKMDDQTKDCLVGFCDSDYATNPDNRKSQTRYIFTMNGATISWKSGLQSVVALSTAEAEYIALTEAVNESYWMKGILGDFGRIQKSVVVHCDSSRAICLTKHQTFHERSKHIDVRMHFIKYEISKGEVEIRKISTDDTADALTKSLPASKFEYCLELVSVLKR